MAQYASGAVSVPIGISEYDFSKLLPENYKGSLPTIEEIEAEVTTARPLDDDQRARLMARLREMTGKDVSLKEKIDPSVMGGVLLTLDGRRYDNTVRHRLQAIRQAMIGE